jgi:TolB-like protein
LNEPIAPPGEGLWSSLRRRKVVQWGIAYVAAAWGLLQGLAYLSTVFQWSAQLQRPATMAFLVGLPIALVLAWYHGDRGHQRVSGREFAILTVLLLLGGGLFWRVGRMPVAPPMTTTAAGVAVGVAQPAAEAKAGGTSIAVLPFVNMSGDKDNEYFSDGISEELLNVLVRVDGLGVASRTSSFSYKGSPLGTAEIAKALRVNHILEGSVRKAGKHVRITAQLIDAVDDRHLWSETYDRELTDIFAIQDEIASAIVAALRGTIGTAKADTAVSVRADTDNLQAYEIYLKARELFIARKDLPESVRLFERVVALDPKFARGWEGLAAVAAVMKSWSYADRNYGELSRSAAERALELDASLSMPWAALARSREDVSPVDWAGSLEMYDRALGADAHNGTALLWRSIVWLNLGFFDRALADQDRCLAQDPGYQNCRRWKALTLLFAGDTARAIALYAEGGAAGFVWNRADSFVGPLLRRGERVGAILLLKELGATPELNAALLEILAQPDGPRSALADEVVRAALADKDSAFSQRVGEEKVYLWLGDYDLVGKTPDLSSDSLVHWEPGYPRFRSSAAFKAVVERLDIAAYWREHGYPPQCRAVGKQDFACS